MRQRHEQHGRWRWLRGLFLLTLAIRLGAQPPALPFPLEPFRFHHLQLPGGVEGNSVNSMVQDSLGFLWFGTHLGLHRYDGYDFVTFRHNPADSTSLSGDYIEWLFIDSQGTLWIGTIGSGLNSFDPATQVFRRYRHDPSDPTTLSGDMVTTIGEDREGRLWVGTFSGLNRLDRATGTFLRFQHDPEDRNTLSHNIVQSILKDREGNLWIGTGFPFFEAGEGGLNRFDPVSETFIRYDRPADDPYRLRTNKVRCLYEDSRSNIWVGSADDGLHRFDPATGRFYHYPNREDAGEGPSQPLLISQPNIQNAVTFISEDRSGRLWIGAHNGGVNCYDPETGQQRHFEPDPADPYSLSSSKTWSFLQTRDGVIWIAASMLNDRIDYLDPVEYLYYSPPGSEPGRPGSFSGLLQDSRGHYWLATLDQLLHYDPEWRRLETFQYEPGRRNTITPETTNVLFEDSQGHIWIGKTTGLNRYDPNKQEMVNFQYDPQDPFSLIDNDVVGVAEDRQGYIWVATTGGLCRFDDTSRKFSHYRSRLSPSHSLSTNYIMRMVGGNGRYIWLGTTLGLSRLDPETGIFANIPFGPVKGIWPAPDGKLWVGCYPGRLLRLDQESLEVEREYGESDGLTGTDVLGLLPGPNGKLWLGTTASVVLFDLAGETFTNLFPSLQTSKWTKPLLTQPDGWAFFTTGAGLVLVHPDSLEIAPVQPRVTLTGIQYHYHDRQPAPDPDPASPIYLADRLLLDHRQNDFSISFSAMQFSQADHIRYQYQLRGYDQEWRSASVSNIASYTNLYPGSYEFWVRATDAYGRWSKQVTRLPIVISSPWWHTWWAILLFVLVGGGLLTVFAYDQFRHQMQKAEARRLQELDEVKNQMYTNLSHEFRTPLAIISGMADQVLEQPDQWFRDGLRLIKSNTRKVLYLVNQMLALRKLEAGKMEVSYEHGDVLPFLRILVNSFHSYAQVNGLTLHFLPGPEKVFMDYDPEKMTNILSNLLSNAVKFTPEGGDIYIKVDVVPAPEQMKPHADGGQALLLRVQDTGIGIPAGQLPHIFDRFFQVSGTAGHQRTPIGSGIGLAIIRELVKLMHGQIKVKSTEGKGTEFSIHLPVTHRAPAMTTTGPQDIAVRVGDYLPVSEILADSLIDERIADADEENPLVLIVDDQPDFLSFLHLSLAGQYRVATATNGEEALEKALAMVPDIVVSDLIMPGWNGMELCERLKADERTSHIPFILLTSQTDPEFRIAGLRHGADAYLAKPFHQEELLLSMRNQLELRETLREHLLAATGLKGGPPGKDDAEKVEAAREDAFVQKAREVILDHLDDFDFNVQALCRKLNMSHSQLHRKLTALTGLSANRFIRTLRLQRAKELLTDPALPVTTIAFDTGFNDPDYFSRVFRREFGLTPTDYRNRTTKTADH